MALCREPSSNPRPLVRRHHHHLPHRLLAAVAHTPCSKTEIRSYRFPVVYVSIFQYNMIHSMRICAGICWDYNYNPRNQQIVSSLSDGKTNASAFKKLLHSCTCAATLAGRKKTQWLQHSRFGHTGGSLPCLTGKGQVLLHQYVKVIVFLAALHGLARRPLMAFRQHEGPKSIRVFRGCQRVLRSASCISTHAQAQNSPSPHHFVDLHNMIIF